MGRCPVCETELTQGFVCDSCGFDSSCGYEQNRTLYPVPPKYAEPVSVLAARWRRQQKQKVALAPGALVCPRCGGTNFSLLVDELQFLCADCETKIPVTAPTGGPVPEVGTAAEAETAAVPDDAPVADPASTDADAAPDGLPEGRTAEPAAPQAIEKEGGWWKSLYLYEWTVLICWFVLMAYLENHPLGDSFYPLRGVMVVPLMLSFAVTQDKLRKNISAGSIILRLFMTFTAAALAVYLCVEAVQFMDLRGSVNIEEWDELLGICVVKVDEQYLQEEKNRFFNNLIVGAAMVPLVFQMYRHWGQERKKAKGSS